MNKSLFSILLVFVLIEVTLTLSPSSKTIHIDPYAKNRYVRAAALETRADACTSLFKPIGGKCYYISGSVTRDFDGAFDYCNQNNMRLASLATQEDNDLVNAYLGDLDFHTTGPKRIWISGRKKSCDSDWMWLGTNTPVAYTQWDKNEPNNKGGNENCIEAFREKDDNILWNDNNCTKVQSFLCETACASQ